VNLHLEPSNINGSRSGLSIGASALKSSAATLKSNASVERTTRFTLIYLIRVFSTKYSANTVAICYQLLSLKALPFTQHTDRAMRLWPAPP
jgi:hypothetical protein